MDDDSGADDQSRVFPYATGVPRQSFSMAAFVSGAVLPYAYAVAAMLAIGLFTARRSAFEAFYALDPEVILAIAFFPALVWFLWRRTRRRGFVAGVITGAVVLPVLALIAIAISFRHGV